MGRHTNQCLIIGRFDEIVGLIECVRIRIRFKDRGDSSSIWDRKGILDGGWEGIGGGGGGNPIFLTPGKGGGGGGNPIFLNTGSGGGRGGPGHPRILISGSAGGAGIIELDTVPNFFTFLIFFLLILIIFCSIFLIPI